MRTIKRFFQLSSPERSRVIQAAFFVLTVRLGLRVAPRWVRRSLAAERGEVVSSAPRREEGISAELVVQAVRRAGRHLPGGRNCLVQALAAQRMLRWLGLAAQVRIGVAKGDAGDLRAHAWVERDGKSVGQDPAVGVYTPLPLL